MSIDASPTRRARPIDAASLAGIVPTRWYPTATVGPLLGRSQATGGRLVRAGKLAGKPDPIDGRRVLVSGQAILELVGGLLMSAAPAPETETERERKTRAR